jgi:DNA-binding PucR family transcriptional regulator
VSATGKSKAAPRGAAATLDELSAAIESGAGLPAVARAAAKALGASVALIDRTSAVLAVAASSSAEEKKLLSDAEGVESVELRVADQPVGTLRFRARGDAADPGVTRMVSTLLALELERSRAPEWADEEAASGFVKALLDRDVTDRADIIARAAEVGIDLGEGAAILIVRTHPQAPQEGDWRARVLTLVSRAARSVSQTALPSLSDGEVAEVVVIAPVADDERLARLGKGLTSELAQVLSGFTVTVAYSRHAADPVDLYRAGKEAMLAANVAEAEGLEVLAFEDTGAYRLLLPAMSEDPGELERFYSETIQPLVAYDEQYETELMATVEAYLENDGNVAATAQQLFTHRHTIRYRLERAKELCGHDVASTEGREKLGLGLKAMRVLGIHSPRGPALEPGASGGKVPRSGEDS